MASRRIESRPAPSSADVVVRPTPSQRTWWASSCFQRTWSARTHPQDHRVPLEILSVLTGRSAGTKATRLLFSSRSSVKPWLHHLVVGRLQPSLNVWFPVPQVAGQRRRSMSSTLVMIGMMSMTSSLMTRPCQAVCEIVSCDYILSLICISRNLYSCERV